MDSPATQYDSALTSVPAWDSLTLHKFVAAQELTVGAMPSRGAEEAEEEKAKNIKGICVGEPCGV